MLINQTFTCFPQSYRAANCLCQFQLFVILIPLPSPHSDKHFAVLRIDATNEPSASKGSTGEMHLGEGRGSERERERRAAKISQAILFACKWPERPCAQWVSKWTDWAPHGRTDRPVSIVQTAVA